MYLRESRQVKYIHYSISDKIVYNVSRIRWISGLESLDWYQLPVFIFDGWLSETIRGNNAVTQYRIMIVYVPVCSPVVCPCLSYTVEPLLFHLIFRIDRSISPCGAADKSFINKLYSVWCTQSSWKMSAYRWMIDFCDTLIRETEINGYLRRAPNSTVFSGLYKPSWATKMKAPNVYTGELRCAQVCAYFLLGRAASSFS